MKKNLLLSFLFLFIFMACSNSDQEPELPLQEKLIYSTTVEITSDEFMQSYGTNYLTYWNGLKYVDDELKFLEGIFLFERNNTNSSRYDQESYHNIRFDYQIEGVDNYKEEGFYVQVQMFSSKIDNEERPTFMLATPKIDRLKPSSEVKEHMEYYKRDYIVSIYVYEEYYRKEAIQPIWFR